MRNQEPRTPSAEPATADAGSRSGAGVANARQTERDGASAKTVHRSDATAAPTDRLSRPWTPVRRPLRTWLPPTGTVRHHGKLRIASVRVSGPFNEGYYVLSEAD